MKRSLTALVFLGALWCASAAEPVWFTDLPKALAAAKAEHKMVLMDFTGSDWCGWCIKFDQEVLSTEKFKEYAAKNLVLVKVDFPRRTPQSEALKQANRALGQKYSVDGYPTFVVLSEGGKEIGRQVGYKPGGPEAFIEKLNGFKKSS
jgi:thioredoxin-related protein